MTMITEIKMIMKMMVTEMMITRIKMITWSMMHGRSEALLGLI
jgi:hypothetical protein